MKVVSILLAPLALAGFAFGQSKLNVPAPGPVLPEHPPLDAERPVAEPTCEPFCGEFTFDQVRPPLAAPELPGTADRAPESRVDQERER